MVVKEPFITRTYVFTLNYTTALFSFESDWPEGVGLFSITARF